MQQVTFIFNGANHHVEEWTYVQNGKHFLLLSRNHFGPMDVTVSVAVIKGVFVRCVRKSLSPIIGSVDSVKIAPNFASASK